MASGADADARSTDGTSLGKLPAMVQNERTEEQGGAGRSLAGNFPRPPVPSP